MVEEELDKPGLETAGQPKPLAISGNTRQQFDGWKDQVCAYLYKKALSSFILIQFFYMLLN